MRTTLAALLVAVTTMPAMAATLTGPAEVIDGDTLVIAGRHVRLFGIDAPEGAQTCDRNDEVWACGEEAARQLREIVGAGEVRCLGSEVDQYGRLLAVCHVGRFELNRTMVEQGWATAFRNYSDDYVADETRAKMARRGIWTSTFDLPQNFRLAQRPQPANQQRSVSADRTSAQPVYQGGCVIKANRSRRGDSIYHLPGMPYYDATRAEEMFCSEAEAQVAGYRRAIVR